MINIDSNWKIVKLSDVIDYINRGIPPIYTEDNSGTVVVNQKCIRDGQVNFQFARLTDESAKPVPQDKIIQPYDILINSTGTGTVGRVGQIVNLTQRTTVDSHVTIVRPKKDEIDPIYLSLWLKYRQKEFEDLAEGSSNQVELSRNKISEVKVILPSLKTQQKIATILTSIDETIQKADRIILKTEILKQGLIDDLIRKGIGHKKFKKTKLGEIPDNWELVKFTTVTEESRLRNDYLTISEDSIMGVNKQLGLIPMKDRVKGKSINRYKIVKKNYFAYNPMRLNIGSIAYSQFGQDILVSPDYVVFRCKVDKVLPDYLNYFRQSFYWKQYTKHSGDGSVRVRIYYSHLNNLHITCPPLDEQSNIVDILKCIDNKIEDEKRKLILLRTLKNGLIHNIFSRKIQTNI